jgi:hypothetical protein
MVSGTPAATPLAAPKLEVMSLRTMPLSVSTLGPFDPSAGNGPAVSAGMASSVEVEPVVVDVAPPVAPLPVVPLVAVVPEAHPTRATRPAPASILSACRRSRRVTRSWARPRSCSWSCS